jgi:hypothetical protein
MTAHDRDLALRLNLRRIAYLLLAAGLGSIIGPAS